MLLHKLKNIFQKAKLPLKDVVQSAVFGGKREDYNFIEEQLILSDIGIETTQKIIKKLKERVKEGVIIGRENIVEELKKILKEILKDPVYFNLDETNIILVSGVNGSGKTTSIGKLANYLVKNEKKVLLGACDTFRAAAFDQIEIWGNRANSFVYIPENEKEPAAAAFESVKYGIENRFDKIIIDTAGRMHTNKNLMEELKKLYNVLKLKFPQLPIFSILIIDATNGKNTLQQAKNFKEAVNIDTIFLTKMDGTAKGGSVITIADELCLPISYIGVGEGIDDLEFFDKDLFVNSIL
ncbi:MAG: signal recognition particle-docking protein FtsY [candidate division WOR-3 bacterium]